MRSLLLVEDEHLIREHIRTMVDWNMHQINIVGEASNGHEAIRLIDTLQPQIVLLDIRMPLMDGIEVLKQRHHCGCIYIVLSAYQDFDYARQCISYGVVEYLLKPIERDKLIAAVTRAGDIAHSRKKQRINAIPSALVQLSKDLTLENGKNVNENEMRKQLFALICDGKEEDVRTFLLDYFETCEIIALGDTDALQLKLIECIVQLASYMEAKLETIRHFNDETSFDVYGIIKKLYALNDKEALKNTMQEQIAALTTHVKHMRYSNIPEISSVIHYIDENYSQNITLNDVARLAFITPNYFSLFFKQKTGMTFQNFLTSYRIQKACNLLLTTNDDIALVAQSVGYWSFRAFQKVFKAYTGTTPHRYRQENRNIAIEETNK